MKALVIVSSDDDRALPGFMWAVNAVKYGWVEDVKVILFGPIEKAIAEGGTSALSHGLRSLKSLESFRWHVRGSRSLRGLRFPCKNIPR